MSQSGALLLTGFLLVASPLLAEESDYQLSLTVTDETGQPAGGMQVVLFHFSETRSTWRLVDSQVTDSQGEIKGFLPGHDHNGVYRLVLRNQAFFEQRKQKTSYPLIPVVVSLSKAEPVSLSLNVSATGYSVSATGR